MIELTPKILVNANGSPVNGMFYSRLQSATITDVSGQKSDTFSVKFENRGNTIPLPNEGDILEPFFGYLETGLMTMGKFVVDGWDKEIGDQGEFLTVNCKSADIRETQKEKGTEHFDDTTLGAMMEKVFARTGTRIEVDPELASKKIEYEARWNQSALDFGTRMADKYNAVFKPAGGKFLMVPRGRQQMLSGARMSSLIIKKSEWTNCTMSGKPRPKHGRVVAKWHDPAAGKTEFESVSTGGKGPLKSLSNTYKSKDEAKAAAEAEGTRLNRESSEGSFTGPGIPWATAEQDVVAMDWGQGIDGAWRADQVEQKFESGNGGYTTTVNVKAPETQKEAA